MSCFFVWVVEIDLVFVSGRRNCFKVLYITL